MASTKKAGEYKEAAQGRPSKYNLAVAAEICMRIAGGELLINICKDAHLPSAQQVRGWDLDDRNGAATPAKGFSALYARAIEIRAEHDMDRLSLIAATPVLAQVLVEREVLDKNGKIKIVKEIRSEDSVAARKLIVDTEKWRISKMSRKYSDAGTLNIGAGKIIIEGGLPEDD